MDAPELICAECGAVFERTEAGTTHHIGSEGETDHDKDADHVPYEDEEP